jgi:tetratricopeptide (TPR) repeat protein
LHLKGRRSTASGSRRRTQAGDPDGAAALYREGLDGFRSIGDPWGQAIVLHMLGSLALEAGDPESARDHYGECVELCRGIGNPENMARGLVGLAAAMLQAGDVDAAEECLLESMELLDSIGMAAAGAAARGLAAVCAARGEFREAASLFGAAEAADARGRLFMIDAAALFEEQRQAALAALGPAVFSAAADEGRSGYPGNSPLRGGAH